MTLSESSNDANPMETPGTPTAGPEQAVQAEGVAADASAEGPRRILIGSQRDPAAYRPRRRDWIPVVEPQDTATAEPGAPAEQASGAGSAAPGDGPAARGRPRRRRSPRRPRGTAAAPQSPREDKPPREDMPSSIIANQEQPPADVHAPAAMPTEPLLGPPKTEAPILVSSISAVKVSSRADVAVPAAPRATAAGKVPPPSIREKLSPDLEDEFSRALSDVALDDMLRGGELDGSEELLEPESKHHARVVAIRRDEVFVELGGREQGCLPLAQFEEAPQVGAVLELVVQRLNADDGLYELRLPDTPAEVEDWGDLAEGMLVEARVTGHNAGGLECQVSQIRGFIPLSQVALYRVEDPAQFVGQQFSCLVTEANPERRNLVLSRRAVLQQEREEARQQFFSSLQPGQIYEGVVRKLVDFGAFVDIGGVDGLLHISQLAWNRLQHPSEVLAEGQKIRVKIEKIDPDTHKISLAYRDLLENPWTNAATKYPANSVVRGTVTKLMEFGAFMQLEPGVEGLIHISELSHRRVPRASDVVHEGDEVEVLVLSVDQEAQRISLSMKALATPPESAKKEAQPAAEASPPPPPPRKPSKPGRPLQGGLGRVRGGSRFGLKW